MKITILYYISCKSSSLSNLSDKEWDGSLWNSVVETKVKSMNEELEFWGWLHREFQPELKFCCDYMKNFSPGTKLETLDILIRYTDLPRQRIKFPRPPDETLQPPHLFPLTNTIDTHAQVSTFSPGWNFVHVIAIFLKQDKCICLENQAGILALVETRHTYIAPRWSVAHFKITRRWQKFCRPSALSSFYPTALK